VQLVESSAEQLLHMVSDSVRAAACWMVVLAGDVSCSRSLPSTTNPSQQKRSAAQVGRIECDGYAGRNPAGGGSATILSQRE